MNVREFYADALARRGYSADAAQRAAVERLQKLYDELEAYNKARSSTIMRLVAPPEAPRGVYLWGGVGRGKSFLMDGFYAVAPVNRKLRIHFHEFMRAVHAELEELKGMSDPLDEVARRVRQRHRLICFDEFHVSDIADAMILYRLMKSLIELGTVFVITSNYPPRELYPDGLHRDRVMPALELLESRLDLLRVDAEIDYRRRTLESVPVYLTPLGDAAERSLNEAFEGLAGGPDENPVLNIEAREITARRRAGTVVWFDFATLCGGPRSQNDYLELAQRFHTVILSAVPRMSAGMSSEARRFTWLIDVLYDHRVKLIMSAEVSPEELYTAGALANEFQRTVSRIVEMQSTEYLHAERRGTASRF
jgi:cell division protein ZapE